MDVLVSLAWKMVDAANEAMGNFIQSNYPGAKTIGKEYVDRKFKRTIECEDGTLVTLIYDYETKTVETYGPDIKPSGKPAKGKEKWK
ncbi:MAG: hypothetical protein LBH43_10000 [Treponema sp.]|jgi:hypothetical protein|nr:hypothetical protein [Treponema sp.]